MIWVDYLIIGIICLSSVVSLIRGFVREAFSLAAWILAFWVSWTFFRDLSVHMPWVEVPSLRLGAAFVTLFLVTLILGALVNFLIGQLVDKSGLSGTDRIVGVLFGAARGVVLVSILVLLAGLTPFPEDPWWQESGLLGYFSELAVWLRDLLPPDIAEKFTFT